VRTQLDAAITVGGLPKFTASFGITESEPGEELIAVLRRADEALMTAKRDGRDKVVLHDPSGSGEAQEDDADFGRALNGRVGAADHS
jgi:hypothetical protein